MTHIIVFNNYTILLNYMFFFHVYNNALSEHVYLSPNLGLGCSLVIGLLLCLLKCTTGLQLNVWQLKGPDVD